MEKIILFLASDQLRFIEQVIASGEYTSSSEVVREALREWADKRRLGFLWDEGIRSGDATSEPLNDIKIEAKRGMD